MRFQFSHFCGKFRLIGHSLENILYNVALQAIIKWIDRINDTPFGTCVYPNWEVEGGEENHENLAIHPIHEPAVSWEKIVEVFDLVRPLDRGREEAAEGRYQGSEQSVENAMDLDGKDVKWYANDGDSVQSRIGEYGIWNAFQGLLSAEGQITQVIHVQRDRANEPMLPSLGNCTT